MILVLVTQLFVDCKSREDETTKVRQGSDSHAMTGIHWQVPERWKVQQPRQMRIATYTVPAASGDSEAGECGVFYFGAGQGGDVESNIARWINQFEPPGVPTRSSRVVDGLKVSMLDLSGTYLASGGPMMATKEKKEGYRLIGAIVEAPNGPVFFKLTGPVATVASAEGEFNELIESVTPR